MADAWPLLRGMATWSASLALRRCSALPGRPVSPPTMSAGLESWGSSQYETYQPVKSLSTGADFALFGATCGRPSECTWRPPGWRGTCLVDETFVEDEHGARGNGDDASCPLGGEVGLDGVFVVICERRDKAALVVWDDAGVCCRDAGECLVGVSEVDPSAIDGVTPAGICGDVAVPGFRGWGVADAALHETIDDLRVAPCGWTSIETLGGWWWTYLADVCRRVKGVCVDHGPLGDDAKFADDGAVEGGGVAEGAKASSDEFRGSVGKGTVGVVKCTRFKLAGSPLMLDLGVDVGADASSEDRTRELGG